MIKKIIDIIGDEITVDVNVERSPIGYIPSITILIPKPINIECPNGILRIQTVITIEMIE